ncbi:hypothetical protein J4419_01850 [Candidatus Woesearchaeota archaeon]|nr:hypothetical protein [Candidatus Woesearchaeota archaeon]
MKKMFFLTLTVFLLLLFLIGGAAYSNGKAVISEPSIDWVSHTEYWGGDDASTIVRLADYRGSPFDVDSCSATILYPNKNVWVSNAPLSESGIAGNWYRTDPLPNINGTYEQEVTCQYSGKSITTSQSFHVNPALERIKTVDKELVALDANLREVNLTLIGTVDSATASLTTSLNVTETNLQSLMNTIHSDLAAQIQTNGGNLSSQLDDAEATVVLRLSETNASLTSRVALAEANLDSLIDAVQADLQARLAAVNASTDARIALAQTTLSAELLSARQAILSSISNSTTTLSDLVSVASVDIQTQLAAVNADLNSKISVTNLSLSGLIGTTGNQITTQLAAANASLGTLMNSLVSDVQSTLAAYLPDIQSTANDVYNDTQWLLTNAMNQDDRAAIDARFDSVDSNLETLKALCGDALTNSSTLCQQVYTTISLVNTARSEQLSYYSSLATTTTNTWDLLSGDITTNINTALARLGIIQSQTTLINETVQAIRTDQIEQVKISVIS